MKMKLLNRSALCAMFLCLFSSGYVNAQTEAKKDKDKSVKPQKEEVVKKEGDRNLMLNASNANEPRKIQIGLPDDDVTVFENGIPAVYSTKVHKIGTHWRSGVSLSKQESTKLTESAITTGNLAYILNSYTELGGDQFKGKIKYAANHFGKNTFDLNVSGPVKNNWYYSVSMFQNFDPGSFKLKFADFQDRTQIYKASITKKLKNNKGAFSILYKYSNSRNFSNTSGLAPFIYRGNGKVSEIPGFNMGTDSYQPVDGILQTKDIRDGKFSRFKMDNSDFNHANEITLLSNYNFDNGMKFKFSGKYTRTTAAWTALNSTNIKIINNGKEEGFELDPNAPTYYYEGTDDLFSGKKQGRVAYTHDGDINSLLFTTELAGTFGNHSWRIGLNEWRYDIDYYSNSIKYDHEVAAYPLRLSQKNSNGDVITYFDYNVAGSEFYEGYENKLALYIADKWNVTDKFRLSYGGRIEYYKVDGKNLPFKRFKDFHIGATTSAGEIVTPTKFGGDFVNYAFSLEGNYSLTKELGLTADFTYTTRYPRIDDYAGATNPQEKKSTIPLIRGGIVFKNDWISATSLVTFIKKTNNYKRLNLSNPAPGSNEIKTAGFNYDIQTLGWTTDLQMTPFKNFNLHFLLTLQNPTFQKYEASVNFDDGTVGKIDASGNNVNGIPKVLIEIDPSYNVTKDLRLWASFRYFSKTYANLSNALYFEGRWETFAGANYKVNKYLSLGASVVNFLNQRGARGNIAGSDLIQKEDASKYDDFWMAGFYLRPLTFEFSASINF